MFFSDLALHKKILMGFLIVALVPSILMGTLSYFAGMNVIKEVHLQSLQSISQLTAEKFETYLQKRADDLHTLQSLIEQDPDLLRSLELRNKSRNPNERISIQRLREPFRAFERVNAYRKILLLSPSGEILYSSHDEAARPAGLGVLTPEFDRWIQEGKLEITFSDPYLESDSNGEWSLLVLAPIRTSEGRVLGEIAVVDSMRQFFESLEKSVKAGVTGEVVIATRLHDEIVFMNLPEGSRSLKALDQSEQGAALAQPMKQALAGNSGAGETVDYLGKTVLAVWRPIEGHNLGLMAKINRVEAEGPVRSLRNLFMTLGLALTALVLLISSFVSRQISKPVQAITHAVRSLGRGEGRLPIELNSSRDEVGVLARAFSDLATSLHETTVSRNELEKEVAARIQKEEELRISQMEAERNQKMAALGMIGAGIAHELNNPMMGILNQVEYALEKTPAQSRVHEVLTQTLQLARRCTGIINDLLSYSRSDHSRNHRQGQTRLSDAIRAAVEMQNRRIEAAGVKLSMRIQQFDDQVGLAPIPLQRIIENLISNACDAMEGRECRELTLELTLNDSEANLSVADTGAGMTPEVHARIFEPFFTTKPVGRGTGLGLVLCKNMLDLLGGRIESRSVAGKGTVFRAVFPLSAGSSSDFKQ